MARMLKSAVLVAKLDRRSRDVAFNSDLMARRAPFFVAERGADADPFMLHLNAALADRRRYRLADHNRVTLATK